MKNILIISQYFTPDITAAAFRIESIYKTLSNKYNVDVLTTTPHKTKIQYNNDNNNIFRVKIKSNKNIFQYIEFLIKAKKILKNVKRKYDYVFISSPPISVFFLLKYISRETKTITDIRDLWPDTIIASGKLNEKSFLFKKLLEYEKNIYKRSYALTCVSKYMKDEIYKKSNKDSTVVYNGIYENDFYKFSEISIKSFERHKKLKICYFGNVGILQNLKPLLEISDDKEIIKDVEITIIGNGNLLSEYKSKYKNVNFKSPVSRNELLEYVVYNYDALFINLIKSKTVEKTIPSKVFDYLLLKKPIISGIKGEGKEILDSFNNSINFEQDSTESLKKAIYTTINNYNFYFNNSVNNFYKLKKYTREENNNKIIDIIEEVYNEFHKSN